MSRLTKIGIKSDQKKIIIFCSFPNHKIFHVLSHRASKIKSLSFVHALSQSYNNPFTFSSLVSFWEIIHISHQSKGCSQSPHHFSFLDCLHILGQEQSGPSTHVSSTGPCHQSSVTVSWCQRRRVRETGCPLHEMTGWLFIACPLPRQAAGVSRRAVLGDLARSWPGSSFFTLESCSSLESVPLLGPYGIHRRDPLSTYVCMYADAGCKVPRSQVSHRILHKALTGFQYRIPEKASR